MDSYEGFHFHTRRERGGIIFRSNAGVVPGLVLVAIGALFFLNNLHIVYIREWFRFWPAILIAVGIVKLVDSSFGGGRVFGGIVAGFGALFLARNLGYLDLSMREIWPLFLVGLGLLMLVQRTSEWHVKVPNPTARSVTAVPSGPDTIRIDAIFGGV